MPNDEPIKTAFCPVSLPSCGISRADFGAAVAVDGQTAVVGHPREAKIHVYERGVAGWSEGNEFQGPEGFGAAVAIHGDWFITGVDNQNAVHVFKRTEDEWALSEVLQVPGAGCFGRYVDIHEDRIAVGDSCASNIQVFQKIGDAWVWEASLEVMGASFLGTHIAIHDMIIVTGTSLGTYAFEFTDPDWQGTLVTEARPRSIDAHGTTVALTSTGRVALVYERQEEEWTRVAEFHPEEESLFSRNVDFGFSLALSQNTLAVGAPWGDPGPGLPGLSGDQEDVCASQNGVRACFPPRPGVVFLYDRGADGGWSHVGKLIGDMAGDHRYGAALDLSRDDGSLVVGAPGRLFAGIGGTLDVDPENSVYLYQNSRLVV